MGCLCEVSRGVRRCIAQAKRYARQCYCRTRCWGRWGSWGGEGVGWRVEGMVVRLWIALREYLLSDGRESWMSLVEQERLLQLLEKESRGCSCMIRGKWMLVNVGGRRLVETVIRVSIFQAVHTTIYTKLTSSVEIFDRASSISFSSSLFACQASSSCICRSFCMADNLVVVS